MIFTLIPFVIFRMTTKVRGCMVWPVFVFFERHRLNTTDRGQRILYDLTKIIRKACLWIGGPEASSFVILVVARRIP